MAKLRCSVTLISSGSSIVDDLSKITGMEETYSVIQSSILPVQVYMLFPSLMISLSLVYTLIYQCYIIIPPSFYIALYKGGQMGKLRHSEAK